MGWKPMKIEKSNFSDSDIILRYEPFFDKLVWTAFIDHKSKIVRPCHGYFKYHPYGVKNERYAKSIGYTFDNN